MPNKVFIDYDSGSQTSGEIEKIQYGNNFDYDDGPITNNRCIESTASYKAGAPIHYTSRPRVMIIRAKIAHDKD